MNPLETLLNRIKERHERFTRNTIQLAREAFEIGAMLTQLRGQIDYGRWGKTLDSIGLPRSTAYQYIRVAENWDTKKGMLQNGIKLCDLYREIGVLPALKGGGARLGKKELERRRAADQMLFHFEQIKPIFREVLKYDGTNPLLDCAKKEIEEAEKAAWKMLTWAQEAKKEAISV